LLVNKKPSGGSYPCHITVNKNGYVLTSNYGDGAVGLLKVGSDGKLQGPMDVHRHEGKGTTDRQEGPHAHSTWFDSDENELISIDLGTNELWFSSIETGNDKLLPREPYKLAMDAGAGPRHMTFHPNNKWAYVINELTSTVTVLRKSKVGIYAKGESVSTLPDDFAGKSFCADIHISADGKFLYASNRGHNSIAIYQVGSKNGSLSMISTESTRGEIPRNFSISPDDKYLLVANQKTNSLVSFARDRKNGMLKFVDQIPVPTPVCILF
ncbi:MAG: lactonase family protein, partial [Cyclobacteriaceae bacterium]